MTAAEEAEFIRLWDEGASYRELAQVFSCPIGTVASRSAALAAQGKIHPRPRGGAKARQGTVHDAVQCGAVHAPLHSAVQVQNSAEPPIPAALAEELGRLWAAIDALRQEMHRPVHETVQSLPEPLFDDPTDNTTEVRSVDQKPSGTLGGLVRRRTGRNSCQPENSCRVSVQFRSPLVRG